MSAAEIPLGDVLSVVDGRLVSRDHIGGVYRVCDHMTGVPSMTHQLPRVMGEIKPAILAQHPWLADIEFPDWPDPVDPDDVFAWLTSVEELYGATVSLTPLPRYEGQDAIEELCDMVGPEKVYVFPAHQACPGREA